MAEDGGSIDAMRVLLVNTPTGEKSLIRDMAGGYGFDGRRDSILLPPLDLTYMASTLLKKGHDVRLLDGNLDRYNNDVISDTITNYDPQVIVGAVSLPTLYSDCDFLKSIRQFSRAKIIAKTSILYEPVLREVALRSAADLCIYGECELTITEIIEGTDRRNSAYFNGKEFVIEQKSVVDNLDDLPLPARQLLDNGEYRYILLGNKVTSMSTSRGCPYTCSYYCPYSLVQGKRYRARSPENVIWEIEDIVQNYDIHKILFRDATFTFDKERIKKICNLIIERMLQVEWWCETRVDCLDLNLMKMMKRAGCLGINIGVETGDPEFMETHAKIGMTMDKLKNVRNAAEQLGLKLHFLLMIGLPGESRRSLYETYRLIHDLRPETIGVCIVTPYPGTPLYLEAKEKGWIETEDWSNYGGHHPVMHTANLSSNDMVIARRMMLDGMFDLKRNTIKSRLKSKIRDFRFKRWSMA
ncbi:MAG: radical SAM protein [Candidatus Omnitrophica bacterium]|nr:radical SAM protein [Candidatus Omnitrophota bacterium]